MLVRSQPPELPRASRDGAIRPQLALLSDNSASMTAGPHCKGSCTGTCLQAASASPAANDPRIVLNSGFTERRTDDTVLNAGPPWFFQRSSMAERPALYRLE